MSEEVPPKNQPGIESEPYDIPDSDEGELELDEFLDQSPEVGGGRDNVPDRVRIIAEILEIYGDHPETRRLINEQRQEPSSAELPFAENVTGDAHRRLEWITSQFPVIEDSQITNRYFSDIEAGILAAKPNELAPVEQEEALIKAAAAHSILLFSNLRLGIWRASKHVVGTMAWTDVVDESILGLNTAIAGFDHTKGFDFSTYATQVVSGHIKRAVAAQARLHRLPVGIHDAWQGIVGDRNEIIQRLGRQPNDEDLARELAGRSNRSLKTARKYLKLVAFDAPSLDQPVGSEEGGGSLGDFQADTADEMDVADQAVARALTAIIFRSDLLTNRQQFVLAMHFGVKELPETKRKFNVKNKATNEPLDHKRLLEAAAALGGLTVSQIAEVLGVADFYIYKVRQEALSAARKTLLASQAKIPTQEPPTKPAPDETPYYRRRQRRRQDNQ